MSEENEILENEAEASEGMSLEEARKWLSRVEGRRQQFARGWWKRAKAAQEMYDMQAEEQAKAKNPFNILYANTEVLLPALYSNTPRPDVRARFSQDKDEIAQAVEYLLTAVVDDNSPGTATLDGAMEAATLGACVPGVGFARLRYYSKATCPFQFETGSYDELIWGYASTWARVPWVSFEHVMTKEQIVEEFNLSEEDALALSVPSQEDKDTDNGGARSTHEEDTCLVHEVWIKKDRKVIFLCSAYEKILLKENADDILKLDNFFPTPGPLTLVKKNKTLDPTPPYEYYRSQAEELQRISGRLKHVLSAIKVRGVYNSMIGDDLARLLSDDEMENKLSPSKTPMDLMGKGFAGHIWLLPIEELIKVARELYLARQETIQVIYQITGIADIVRGQSQASESATGVNVKDKWAGVRLRRNQKRVADYARDLLRLTVDAASEILPEGQWKAITQLPYPTSLEKKQAQQTLQAFQQMQQIMGPQQPGQAPVMQPPPQVAQAAQSKSWGELLSVLKTDKSRVYSIDIETYSTIDPDAQIDKEEVSEFMGAMGQFVSGAAPLVQLQGGAEVAKELLLAIASKYKFGRSVTAALRKLGGPMPQPQEGEKAAPEKPDHALEVAQLRAQTDLQRTQMQTASAEKIAQLDAQVKLLIEKMDAQNEMMKEQLGLKKDLILSQVQGAQQASAQERQFSQEKEKFSLQDQSQQRRDEFQAKNQLQRDKLAAKNKPKPAPNGRR